MKIRHIHIFAAIIIIIGGGIGMASYMGLFGTTRPAEPIKLTEDVYDIADIRGSFTLEDLDTYYQIPPEAIVKAFNLDTDIDSSLFQLKELKEIYQPIEIEGEEVAIETDSVKVFVSLFSDIPYISEETFYLPDRAVDYLIAEDKLTRNEEDYWTKHTFNLTSAQISEEIEDVTEIREEENEAISITGGMTVAEIIAMGIDRDTFQQITGLDIPEDKTIAIRDFFASKGLEFSLYKEKMESFLSE